MRPDPPLVMQGIMKALMMQVAPEVRTPFGQQTVGLSATLLGMIAQEYDRAAERLVAEDDAIVEILREALELLPEEDLRSRVAAATVADYHRDLRISALQRENDELRRLLIEVHAAVERQEGPGARDLEGLIWDELRESTRRRHVVSGLA